ncbi:transcription elongation factor GreA [Candidatus Campbellbacteria bacterium RIFCSPLOWO2_02_FULL_35_11]|uniref:Transcription elongation factor GreA n=2 Tax=Candidatus Campbelliibacteriota TaxID=1752727 RepID=A0A1F5ELB3_9BACT|nr:MAG: transcription elongation factor GreA [Candidatus Campbellbacteria bacterium RIFCSPHIGHO2_12_FULL_35_10]OGD70426.1 MAG: transcription elongation factor GreA [Candidatus Campbellbacteria bacterium RIFCSPLOWO2_02_FULL_35_11]
MMEKEYLTKERYEELKNELEHLTSVKRKEIAVELDQAVSLGDLKENAEYHQAREDQANLESRISQIESVLKEAEIVKGGKKDIAGVGSMVKICKKGKKDCIEYKLVGAEESNTVEGKISAQSPLGRAMLGKKVGDDFTFEAPKGKMEYKIVEIK